MCGLFCLFFWLPSRHGLLHWSGCRPTSTVCWPSPDPNNKVTLAGAKINVSLQLPVPTADASVCVTGHEAGTAAPSPSIPLVRIGPQTWSFVFRGTFRALQPGELFLNALYLEKCEVVRRKLAVKWTETERRACTMWKLHARKHGSASAFCVALVHVGGCVSVSSGCTVCMPEGLFQREPISDVSRIAHDRSSSSVSQFKAF